MKLQVALVDDWELRGDGSGDMEKIQFQSLEKILKVYEKYNLKASINAEIMQQLAHLEWGVQYPNLMSLAKKWEDVVKGAYLRGHDVQLHVHSQWVGAKYENNKWHLPGNWSILTYSKDEVRAMVVKCKNYLHDLLQAQDSSYRCVSFRSGAWCLAPSDFMCELLAEEGIIFDMSIVGGLKYDNAKIKLDYTQCEEAFLPYYPYMKDARKVSDKVEQLVCIPTFSFKNKPTFVAIKIFSRVMGKILSKGGINFSPFKKPSYSTIVESLSSNDDYTVWETSMLTTLKNSFKDVTADLSMLSFPEMKQLIQEARKKAKAHNVDVMPIVLENHTKDINYLEPIEKFAKYITSVSDVEVITLKQMAENVKNGIYKIKHVTRA